MFNQQIPMYENRIEKFLLRLQSLFYENKISLNIEYRKFKGFEKFIDRLKGNYEKLEVGQTWGRDWQRAWFRLTGTVPIAWKGKEVIAHLNLGGEGLKFDENGVPDYALTLHTIWPIANFRRDRIRLINRAKGTENINLWFELSAAQLLGIELENDRGHMAPKTYGRYEAAIEYADLAVFRRDIWDLYLDANVLFDQMKASPEKSVRRARILHGISKAIDHFTGDAETTAQSREILKPLLASKSGDSDLQTLAVGHAHLDTAWLWPLDETIRKCARTFSAQIALLEKYPDYVFGASQPQHYAFIKEYYPGLYKKVREYVKKGRIEVQGGMWVEADCNLISGESMVRQIIHGKNFFKDEFGVDVRNLWLPDVFGYSAAMPQILRKSGIDFFVTQKISWNQFNRFPHHTFIWRGIDGAEITTHFPPEDNYNSELKPDALIKARDNFDEKAYLNEFLTLFGIGDGGSGPTEEMIETGLRQQNLEGVPQVRFGHAQDMLDRLALKQDELPVWVGELYLELHRGTLTTQAYNKKMNRYMELKLREIEVLFSLLPLDKYPAERLDEMWKKVLLHQFHDIIPGSSITPVYEDSRKVYEKLVTKSEDLFGQAGELLFKNDDQKLTIINTLSFQYQRPICLPGEWADYQLHGENGQRIISQIENDNIVIHLDLAPLSAVTLQKGSKITTQENNKDHPLFVLENDLIRYEFDEDGAISHIFDKESSKSVLTETGKGNLFGFYEDRPVDWDAWDVDIFYENQLLAHPKLQERIWISNGPVRQGILQKSKVGNSTITQKIYLSFNSKRLDFETEVDWQETHKMLRVSFAVNIIFDTAAYEIQYGHVRRNTHRNTSWDMAKFEVVGHRYADLSDKNYGVALLNNCKYGYKIHDNIIDLNLLRSPTLPDPKADRGGHQFTYSLFPHKDEMINSAVFSEAAQLNQPPALFGGLDGAQLKFPVALDSEEVVLDVLKKAEKEDVLIVRLYEPYGKSTKIQLKFVSNVIEVHEVDLMENPIEKLNLSDRKLQLDFKAFEIKTLKIIGR